jgi:hypothetical protein
MTQGDTMYLAIPRQRQQRIDPQHQFFRRVYRAGQQRRHTYHAEMEYTRRILCDRFPGLRRGAWHEHNGFANAIHDVHDLRHQRLRAVHCYD